MTRMAGLGMIDTFFRPWTGEVQAHIPTDEEKTATGLPDQAPGFAIHGRWYAVTIYKNEEVFEPEADGSFRDGDRVINLLDRRLSIAVRNFFFFGGVSWRVAESEDGKFRCYSASSGQYITFSIDDEGRLHKKSKIRDVLDSTTGDLYRLDPVHIIRLKCFESLFGNPIHMVGAMAFNLCRTVIDPFLLPILAGVDLALDLYDRDDEAWDYFKKRMIQEIPLELVQNIWNIARCVIYAVPIEIALLYGVVYPLEGRAKVSKLEGLWKHPYTFKDDIRYLVKDGDHSLKTFFLGWCFQPICNIYDKDPEGNYLVHIDGVKPVPSFPSLERSIIT